MTGSRDALSMASQWRSCWIRISHISAATIILHVIFISDSLCSEDIRKNEGATAGGARSPDYGRLPQIHRQNFENVDSSKPQTFPLNAGSYRTAENGKLYEKGGATLAKGKLVFLPPKFEDLEQREGSDVVEQLAPAVDSRGVYSKGKVLPALGRVRRVSKRASVYFEDADMTDTTHEERGAEGGEQASAGNLTSHNAVDARGPKRSPKFAGVDPRNGSSSSSALLKKARNLFHVGGDPAVGATPREENVTDGWAVEKAPASVVDQGLDAAIVTAISLGAVVCVSLLGAVGLVLYRRRSMSPKPQTLSDKCSNPDSSAYIEESSDDSEEMYSLDNDSFLNSLEAMTIQNLWTDNVKHTKL